MEIISRSFSEQPLVTNSIIQFPEGIPGFEDHKQFQLVQQQGSEIIFLLQSIKDEDIAFSVAQPHLFNINYRFILTEEEVAILDLQSPDEILILLILHRDADNNDPSGNPTIKGSIKSPLIINIVHNIGIQKPLATIEQSITLTEKHNVIDVAET